MPGVCEVRINRRRNLVSADVLTEEARKRLLGITSLLYTSVHAFEAPPTDGYIGAVHGVSREVPTSTIADSIESAVPVKSVRRGPHAVAVRFTAPPPDHVFIAGMRFAAAPGGSDVRGDLLARVPRPQQGDPSGPELPGPRSYLRPRGYHFGQGPGQFPCPRPPPPEHQGKPQAPGPHCLEHLPACGLDGLPAHRRCLPSTRQTPAPPEPDRERTRLLEAFNAIWGSATLPEDWLTAVVVPILKPRKSSRLPCSYRPVSLTSTACKTMEAIALSRLTWIARVTNFLPEQLTGFRRGRCTADSIADLVSTLEDARHDGDAVMLVLLDVKAAFDTLPHSVINEALSRLEVTGPLLEFIQALLQGRTFRVRVGAQLSSPRPVAAGVQQSSVLSPFLFNLALAGLPASLKSRSSHRVRCSVYADDVALWVRGTPRRIRSMCTSLQTALDAAQAYLSSIGLTVSPAKTEALLYHPRGRRAHITTLRLGADGLTWRDQVKYLGLLIDRRLTWLPAVRALLPHLRRIGQAVQRLQARDKGCSPS
ncbi:hypothetical protein V5799_010395 [Amblyomma americanum]|uniref:Reverse transcriptase domain-containing protein n=1 Tax=Amblyomma americanum TaxID=6943 RepID=A0AAQ4EJY0_AMBAM